MNVEYRCQECGRRVYAPPGGTRIKCRIHPEAAMEQQDYWEGADFREGGTHVAGGGVDLASAKFVAGSTTPITEARLNYERQTGLTVDKRWNVDRVKMETDLWLKEHASESETNDSEEGPVHASQ